MVVGGAEGGGRAVKLISLRLFRPNISVKKNIFKLSKSADDGL